MKFGLSFWGLLCLPLFLAASPVKLYCWIVADDTGESHHSPESITNQVVSLNRIYSQVAMSFTIESISQTNCTRLANVVYSNATQKAELCALASQADGLEVYFVESITENTAAFCGRSGIVVSRDVNGTTLAHEIGHACGLSDIYDSYSRETDLAVTGMLQKIYFTHDWGWYPENVTQAQLVQRLLMYGYNTGSTHKGDISRGDVYGLWYEQVWNPSRNAYDKVWQLGLAPVGFKLHGNRHPVSE